MLRKAALAAAIAALVASAAAADHAFIMPSASNLSDAGIVAVDAAAADNLFQFDHRPVPLEQIRVYRPDGSEASAPDGVTGRVRSSFDLKVDAPGTWKIAAVNRMVSGTAMIGGQERRVTTMRAMPRPGDALRQPPIQLSELPADATDLKLTETIGRTEAFVTLGTPTTQVFGAGDTAGLTLQPVTHPTDLVSNEPARFGFLLDGKPAAGVKVTLIPSGQRFRNDEAGIGLTADARGVVTIRWPAPGYYLLTATAGDAKAAEKRAAVRRLVYAATLEVAAP